MKVLTHSKIQSKESINLKSEKPVWWIKLTHWEFWPFNVFYFPLFFYYAWLCLKARSFFFFSASNPGIEYGGMLGESKIKILDKFRDSHKPYTLLIEPGLKRDEFEKILQESKLTYPFILKPDIGERGWMVKKISNSEQLDRYLSQIKVPFLLQELIESPVEMGVFYYRMPDEEFGKVTSIVLKEMMTVVGDGVSDIKTLLLKNPRSVITLDEIEKTSGELFDYIPELGEEVEAVPIGNHCRGTTFLNGNDLINEQVHRAVDTVAKQHDGFYFGRFDLRCDSLEDLAKGNFKIFELNGAGAEPAHIYQPGFSLLRAYRDLIFHQSLMYKIARKNNQLGVPYMTVKEGLKLIKFLRHYNSMKG